MLTTEEVEKSLIALGGLDVQIIKLKGGLGSIKHFVIACGRTPRHLRVMGDTVVKAVRTALHSIYIHSLSTNLSLIAKAAQVEKCYWI